MTEFPQFCISCRECWRETVEIGIVSKGKRVRLLMECRSCGNSVDVSMPLHKTELQAMRP